MTVICPSCKRKICQYFPDCKRLNENHKYLEECHGCIPCSHEGCDCAFLRPNFGMQGGAFSDYTQCTNCKHKNTHNPPKPVCKYGSNCKRKNVHHIREFHSDD